MLLNILLCGGQPTGPRQNSPHVLKRPRCRAGENPGRQKLQHLLLLRPLRVGHSAHNTYLNGLVSFSQVFYEVVPIFQIRKWTMGSPGMHFPSLEGGRAGVRSQVQPVLGASRITYATPSSLCRATQLQPFRVGATAVILQLK